MPVTQYNGVTLIRQNIGFKCISDSPSFVEATEEQSDMEGFFCNLRFVGNKKDFSKIPAQVKVSVVVSSTHKGVAKHYKSEVLKYDVKLVSKVYVEDGFKRAINLGQFTRSQTIAVRSLSDFSVTSSVSDDRLKITKSRDSSKPNFFNVNLLVPKSTNFGFTASLDFKNHATGEQSSVPLRFDPRDERGKTKPPKQDSKLDSNQQKAQEGPKFEAHDGSKKSHSDKKKNPKFMSFVIMFGFIGLLYMLIKDNDLFRKGTDFIQGLFGNLSGGKRGDISADRSFMTANDRSKSNSNIRGPYAKVRDHHNLTSPDAKMGRDAPVHRFAHSRGSVRSPQDFNRVADRDSMHADFHY